jgi:hypothetical protein
MRADAFLGRARAAGLHVYVSRHGVEANGEGRAAEAARKALESVPSLADEVKALLLPSIEDMQDWLSRQSETVQAEHAARLERLTAAGIPEPERVALRTTWADHNSALPDRLKPITGASK